MKSIQIFLTMTLAFAFPADVWPKTEFKYKVIYENRYENVSLMYETDEDNTVVAQDFEHPVQITADKVSGLLEKLKYSTSLLTMWKGNYDVFFDSELENLSKQISRAFQAASSNEWIKFASTVMSRDSIDPIPLLTDGYIFKSQGKIHVVMLNVKKENTKDNRPQGGDPREHVSLPFKRINPTEEISYPPVIPGSRFLDKPHYNWAVIEMDASSGQKKEMDVEAEKTLNVEKKDLIERMKILKDLYEKDLITEEEYDRKKEEILNEL